MGTTRATSFVAVVTAFFIGSLSAHCGPSVRAPNAVAAEPCPPPPCASAAPRPASLTAAASARVEAARKYRNLVDAVYLHGGATMTARIAADELVFRAVRDSGVVGPELVDAATQYHDAARHALELGQRRQNAIGGDELLRAEYAVAEAEFWLEEAKTKR